MAEPTSFTDIDGRNNLAGNHFSGATTINFTDTSNIGSRAQNPLVCRAIHFPRNDDFVPRPSIQEQIERLLPSKTEYQSAALCGLGGSGKTQIALQYAYNRCSDPTCSVFWIHADTETSFIQDYKWIATKLGLASSLDGEDLLVAVRSQVETLPQWVFILDNADDLTLFGVGHSPNMTESARDLSAYIPRGLIGTVLWTSRDRRIAGSLVGPQRGINVIRMTDTESQMLLKTTGAIEIHSDEFKIVAELFVELDWLPLAISQAAAYIRRTKLSIGEYLKKIQERKKRWSLLRRSEHDRYRKPQASNSVLETWNISMDYLQQENKMAYYILMVLAYVDSQNIPFEMIVKIVQNSSNKTPNKSTSNTDSDTSDYEDETEDDVIEAVARLEEFSYLTLREVEEGNRSQTDRSFNMHKLVQEAISYRLRKGKHDISGEAHSIKAAFQAVNILFPTQWHRETWDQCEKYLGHLQRVVEWAYDQEDVKLLLFRASDYLFDRARWREREIMDVKIVGFFTRVGGDNHPRTMASKVRLAASYIQQWRYEEAEKLLLEVSKLQRDALGDKHPDTIRSVADIATVYHAQGRYNEAENIHHEVLKLRQDMLGNKHPDTIRSMQSLAITYSAKGRSNEAENIHREVLELRRDILGDKHPDTIFSMENLATTYYEQERYNEAEKMDTEVLKLRQDILGDNHMNTIKSMFDLATTYHAQGRYDEAEKINSKVLELRREMLGDNHPDTIFSMENIATALYTEGRYNEAENMHTEVLRLRQGVLGRKHPITLWSMTALGRIYYSQKRYQMAEKIFTDVLELRQEVLGDAHPDTIKSIGDLEAARGALGL